MVVAGLVDPHERGTWGPIELLTVAAEVEAAAVGADQIDVAVAVKVAVCQALAVFVVAGRELERHGVLTGF